MTQVEEDPTEREQQCQAAVDRFITTYRCRVLSRAEFVRRTLDHLHQGTVADPYKAATGVYSLVLYSACSGAEGAEQQERGYEELYHYLHNIAVWRYPQGCDDVTQGAILHIFEHFSRCHHPIAFLAFAIQQLMNQIRKLRSQNLRQGDAFGDEFQSNPPPDPNQLDPLDLAVAEELRSQIQQELAAFRRAYPKAARQIDALEMKYLRGMDDQAISNALGFPVKSVYERRARAFQKLRADVRWRNLAVVFGLLPPDS